MKLAIKTQRGLRGMIWEKEEKALWKENYPNRKLPKTLTRAKAIGDINKRINALQEAQEVHQRSGTSISIVTKNKLRDLLHLKRALSFLER
ncbi:MAG: hypothetical protein V1911_01820 [Candidatus Micrarchaeota archaeon]